MNDLRVRIFNLLSIMLIISYIIGCNSSSSNNPNHKITYDVVNIFDPNDNEGDRCSLNNFFAEAAVDSDQLNVKTYLNPSNFLSVIIEMSADEALWSCAQYGLDPDNFSISTPKAYFGDENKIFSSVLGLTPDTIFWIKPFIMKINGQLISSEIIQIQTPSWPEQWPLPHVEDLSNGKGADLFGWNGREVFCTPQSIPGDSIPFALYMCVNRNGTPIWYYIHENKFILGFVERLSDGTLVSIMDNRILFFNIYNEVVAEYDIEWFGGKTKYLHENFHHDVMEIEEGEWAGAIAIITRATETVNYNLSDELRSGHISSSECLNNPNLTTNLPITETLFSDGIIVFDRYKEAVLWDWSLNGTSGDNQTIDDEKIKYCRRGLGGEVTFRDGVDFTHANSLLHGIDEQGQFFWLSLRNQDWIVKIIVETEKIEWRLGYQGDFRLVDDAINPTAELDDENWTFRQHRPVWLSTTSGTYEFLVFDNGTVRNNLPGQDPDSSNYSRIVKFILDETNMVASPQVIFGDKDPASLKCFYTPFAGDLDLLPGNHTFLMTSVVPDIVTKLSEIEFTTGNSIYKLEYNQVDRWPGFVYRSNYYSDLYR
jgi:Arylsulfotransferase (ASST)